MNGLAITLLSSGLWLVYSGVTNRAPIRTLISILQNPGDARNIVHAKANRIDPNAPDLNPVTLQPHGGTGLQANPVSGTPTSTGSGATIVAFARSQIGKPYQTGGSGNPGWDCSGLVQSALATVGVQVSHSALAQLGSPKGKIIDANIKNLSNLQPGDIIFPAATPELLGNHVAVYSGGGNIIEAAYPGSKVRERAIYPFLIAKRFTI